MPEIRATVEPSVRPNTRVAELARAGYQFARDDVVTSAEHLAGLYRDGVSTSESLNKPFCQTGRICSRKKLQQSMSSKRPLALASVASRVINFGRPNNLIGKQLEASQITLRQLLAVMRANADNNCIAAVIKQHASIGLMLRRLVNAPGSGVANRVDSSHELAKCLAGANSGAGCRRCRMHWRAGTRHAIPLLARGKLLKLIAHRLAPKQHAVADTAFRVGIVALMDTLFHQPMVATMLSQIVVSDDVSRALLERSGFFGDPLKLAEWIERLDVVCELALPILVKLRLWAKALNTMQLRGFEWGNQLSDPMRWQQHVLDATGMRPVS